MGSLNWSPWRILGRARARDNKEAGGGGGQEQIPGFGDRVRMRRAGAEWASGEGRFMEQRENSDAGEARGTSTFLTSRQSLREAARKR